MDVQKRIRKRKKNDTSELRKKRQRQTAKRTEEKGEPSENSNNKYITMKKKRKATNKPNEQNSLFAVFNTFNRQQHIQFTSSATHTNYHWHDFSLYVHKTHGLHTHTRIRSNISLPMLFYHTSNAAALCMPLLRVCLFFGQQK